MSKPTRNDSGAIKYAGNLHKAAKTLGSKGGKVSSPEKTAAVRENGKLGGGSHK